MNEQYFKLTGQEAGAYVEGRCKQLFLLYAWTVFRVEGREIEVDMIVYNRITKTSFRVQSKAAGTKAYSKNGSFTSVVQVSRRNGNVKYYNRYEPDDFDYLFTYDPFTERDFLIGWPAFCSGWSNGSTPTRITLDHKMIPYLAERWSGWATSPCAGREGLKREYTQLELS